MCILLGSITYLFPALLSASFSSSQNVKDEAWEAQVCSGNYFTRPNECLDMPRQMSAYSDVLRENMKQFAHSILEIVSEVRDEGCQTDDLSNGSMTYFLKNQTNFQKSFLISNLWTDITDEDQTKLMFMFYSNVNTSQQCDLF